MKFLYDRLPFSFSQNKLCNLAYSGIYAMYVLCSLSVFVFCSLCPPSCQSRSQRLRSFWSAPRKQDLWANQCQNPAIRNLIGCCILPEVSLNRRFQRQEIWKDIRNWAKQKTQSKCHQMCIQFFAAKKHEKIISARGSHD